MARVLSTSGKCSNASFIKFDAQCRLVERFEKARTERAMHFDRCTDDALGEIVDVFELCASVSLWLIHSFVFYLSSQ